MYTHLIAPTHIQSALLKSDPCELYSFVSQGIIFHPNKAQLSFWIGVETGGLRGRDEK